jgi:glycolate oxidase FAD binding subunit
MTTTIEILQSQVQAAAASGTPLRIRAGGSKDFYGESFEGDVLDVSGYAGIVEYEPTELVLTAKAGTPLAEIEAALAANNQCLAFEPPHFGSGANDRATIGGAIASGLAGPRRATAGAPRDYVLGVRIIDGRGQQLRFGGTVMKNVAGYDVSRLMAGSLGTLGLITEVSVKVLPRPIAEATLQFEMDKTLAIARMNEWAGQPLPLSGSVWHERILRVRLSGAPVAIDAAAQKMGGTMVDPQRTADFWRGIREQTDRYFLQRRDEEALVRISVPAATPPLGLRGTTLMEWGGAQRWLIGGDLAAARKAAALAGGHAVRFRGNVGSFMQPLDPVAARIHANLKREFDPHNIFNRGRMFADQ